MSLLSRSLPTSTTTRDEGNVDADKICVYLSACAAVRLQLGGRKTSAHRVRGEGNDGLCDAD